ncbi:MAG TPA: hypothetical protein VGG33_11995 [Polyangia bacterium]
MARATQIGLWPVSSSTNTAASSPVVFIGVGGLAASGMALGAALAQYAATPKELKGAHETYGLSDPAAEIGRLLIEEFSKRHGLAVQPSQDLYAERWVRDHWKVDLVLDVHTTKMHLVPYSEDSDRYQFAYVGHLELYDARNKQALAWGNCVTQGQGVKTAPTFKELIANDGERLKRMRRDVIQICVRLLAHEVLRM